MKTLEEKKETLRKLFASCVKRTIQHQKAHDLVLGDIPVFIDAYVDLAIEKLALKEVVPVETSSAG